LSAPKPRYEVLWTETARRDVEEIAPFIAHDSVKNALAVLDRLEHAVENLAFLPERGRFVPELKQLGVLAYREIIVRPWRIIYRLMSIVLLACKTIQEGRSTIARGIPILVYER
jgi:toxin ParE1/3/4